jgi:hypothetical protein
MCDVEDRGSRRGFQAASCGVRCLCLCPCGIDRSATPLGAACCRAKMTVIMNATVGTPPTKPPAATPTGCRSFPRRGTRRCPWSPSHCRPPQSLRRAPRRVGRGRVCEAESGPTTRTSVRNTQYTREHAHAHAHARDGREHAAGTHCRLHRAVCSVHTGHSQQRPLFTSRSVLHE